MRWPALIWRGQEWAQHVQGQLLHTCIMQIAGSHHAMELPLTVYKCRASLVKLLLGITFVLRAVLCAVRIKTQKEIIFLRVLLYCMTNSYPLEQFSSFIEMPESGYNMGARPGSLKFRDNY